MSFCRITFLFSTIRFIIPPAYASSIPVVLLPPVFAQVGELELYTNKSFENGSAARKVLEYNLADKISGNRTKAQIILRLCKPLQKHAAAGDGNFSGGKRSADAECAQRRNAPVVGELLCAH